jgi:hypothetical protein
MSVKYMSVPLSPRNLVHYLEKLDEQGMVYHWVVVNHNSQADNHIDTTLLEMNLMVDSSDVGVLMFVHTDGKVSARAQLPVG